MLAQTKLLVPNIFPNNRAAESSTARVVIPAANTEKYKYFRAVAEIIFFFPKSTS
jgi:hypothetical protein